MIGVGRYRQPPNYSLRYYGEFAYSRCFLCGHEEDGSHTLLFCLAHRHWRTRFAGLLAQAIDVSLQRLRP